MNYKTFQQGSKAYLNNPKYKIGHVIQNSDSCVLISAPHGVLQTRLGKSKVAEIGSARLALYLSQYHNTNLIIKTCNLFDDANYDVNCNYRRDIAHMLADGNIKYLLDFHGLAASRSCDVNFGINHGNNIVTNPKLFDTIVKILENAGFIVSVDMPFCAPYKTIAGEFSKEFGIFTLQIEVNSAITNRKENINRLIRLINCFISAINLLK